MPPSPPALPADILEEIFLRLPPAEPECLVRASLASKLWLGLLTGARFRGLYRQRHGAPPMLGFIYSCSTPDYSPELQGKFPIFVATTKFCVRVDDCEGWHWDYAPWDCRHGRVLFCNNNIMPMPLMVWDPMMGRRTLQYAPEEYDSQGAAVLCNVAGCDHGACHSGAFQLVFVGLNNIGGGGGSVACAHVSLPGLGMWSDPCPALHLAAQDASIVDKPPVLIQGALYFLLVSEFDDDNDDFNMAILKFDLRSSCLSLIDAPPVEIGRAVDTLLVATEDGSLGFAYADTLTINMWARHMGSNGVAAWTRRRVITLNTPAPTQNPEAKLGLIGSVECNDIIFVTKELGIYEINLKSVQVKKIWKKEKMPCFVSIHEFLQSA